MTAPKTILFVDDSALDRTLIDKVLSKHGFSVILAETGRDGLRLAQERQPDLILLDILLPGISGIEVCKQLKNNPGTKSIPVFFYTSLETPKELINYPAYGAQNYLQKTMSPEKLVDEIRAFLDVKSAL